MKTDTYTKIVLTIIALVLTINTLQNFDFIPRAYANETSAFAPMDVNLKSIDGARIGLVPAGNDPNGEQVFSLAVTVMD
jgi:hypothetical protein